MMPVKLISTTCTIVTVLCGVIKWAYSENDK